MFRKFILSLLRPPPPATHTLIINPSHVYTTCSQIARQSLILHIDFYPSLDNCPICTSIGAFYKTIASISISTRHVITANSLHQSPHKSPDNSLIVLTRLPQFTDLARKYITLHLTSHASRRNSPSTPSLYTLCHIITLLYINLRTSLDHHPPRHHHQHALLAR